MKQVITINMHSFVDVITNSSSELFVLADGNEIEAVREMLQLMLDHWNAMAAAGVFGSHYTRNKRKSLKGEPPVPAKPTKTFEDTFGRIYRYTEEDYKRDARWAREFSFRHGYEKRQNIGKIFVESAGDNSIPPEMFDWMISAFGYSTESYHLG